MRLRLAASYSLLVTLAALTVSCGVQPEEPEEKEPPPMFQTAGYMECLENFNNVAAYCQKIQQAISYLILHPNVTCRNFGADAWDRYNTDAFWLGTNYAYGARAWLDYHDPYPNTTELSIPVFSAEYSTADLAGLIAHEEVHHTTQSTSEALPNAVYELCSVDSAYGGGVE